MLGILFLLLAAAPALAAALTVHRAHRQGRRIGCGRCDRTPGHRCILDAARPGDRAQP